MSVASGGVLVFKSLKYKIMNYYEIKATIPFVRSFCTADILNS